MDPLTQLLQGVRATHSVVHRSILEPPWALRIEERAQLTLATVLTGRCHIVFDDGETVDLAPGEVAIIATADPYLVADDPASPVDLTVRPAGAYLPDGSLLPAGPDPITCALDENGSTALISGNYVVEGDVSRRLLDALPRLAIVRLAHGATLFALLAGELTTAAPGQQAALDRWLDLALVTTLRTWFADSETGPGWYLALADPMIGPAISAMHDDPARGWTIDQLARRCATSRTPFVRRFTAVVGEPPIGYLTRLRLDLAADLLRSGNEPLAAIAERVGYATPFGFSAAFKRQTGLSPAHFRGRHRTESA